MSNQFLLYITRPQAILLISFAFYFLTQVCIKQDICSKNRYFTFKHPHGCYGSQNFLNSSKPSSLVSKLNDVFIFKQSRPNHLW